MATLAKVQKGKVTIPVKKVEDNQPVSFAFGKINYILLVSGVLLIILGFVLMTGGSSSDPNVFNYDMFNFQRLTLAPILVLLGFGVEIVAIMLKPRD
jgi:hypothetical protein